MFKGIDLKIIIVVHEIDEMMVLLIGLILQIITVNNIIIDKTICCD